MKRKTPENQGSFNWDDPPPDPRETIKKWGVSPARFTDPGTSHIAGQRLPKHKTRQRLRVYDFYAGIGLYGATDYECGYSLGILRTSAGKRRKELEEAGFIEKTRERRHTDTGTSAIVWRLKDYWLEYEAHRPKEPSESESAVVTQ